MLKTILCIVILLADMWLLFYVGSEIFEAALTIELESHSLIGPWFLLPAMITLSAACVAIGYYPARYLGLRL